MAKETEEKKKERLDLEKAVRLTYNLIEWLIHEEKSLDHIGLTKREKDVLKMKWMYGLTLEQIAENLSVSKVTARNIHDKVTARIYFCIPKLLAEYPDKKTMLAENEELKHEIEIYKARLDSLSIEQKEELRKNDITAKHIDDINLTKSTKNRLMSEGINTVQDLLKLDITDLLAIKYFTVRMLRNVEYTLMEHNLYLRKK